MADAAGASKGSEKPANIGPDGETIVDMEFYELLGVRGDANENDIKKAYRKAAIKWHPDKNPGNPEAEQKFRDISEAYNCLQDSNLRAVYNKQGKKKPGEEGAEDVDPMAMFGNMFGGEAFVDWVGEISLFKDFAKMADISTTEEEKEALRKEMGDDSVATSDDAATASTPAAAAAASTPDTPAQAKAEEIKSEATSAAAAKSGSSSPSAAAGATAGAGAKPHPADASLSTHTSSSGANTPATAKSQKGDKLSEEQKAQLNKMTDERAKEREERISTLAKKLVDRCRAFENAAKPGDATDIETQNFERRLREEAEDMKAQSFGVELLQLIGAVYMSKASTYLKLHKGTFSNFAGIPGFFSRLKDKKDTLKEGWSFLTTTLDVQSAMEEMQRRQENGAAEESEEMKELEGDMVGKLLLVSWKGTKFELNGILRNVVDVALTKDSSTNEKTLQNRAKAILLIGTIFSRAQPDEGDDERRELEKLMAEAATKKRAKRKHGSKTAAAAGGASAAGAEAKKEDGPSVKA